MNSDYRELLTNLRCDINLIRDCSFSAVRDAATRMIILIDNALATPGPVTVSETKSLDIAGIPSGILLHEISRRMHAGRHVRKFCSRCKTNPVRARDLCVRCYKKAYRRGEIKHASR